jgi:tRNA(Ile)-lysidine synthase
VAALDPAVAAVRTAVRRRLLALGAGDHGPGLVLVACSGGADSLALSAAVAFVAPRVGLRAGLVTVDHQLQPGSAERADAVAAWGRAEGFEPVVVVPVRVAGRTGGPEAAAREARYEGLVRTAREHGASAVLLGHTQDDQAETVLLALLRGAGPRGVAGMPEARAVDSVTLVRPLLGVSRAQTQAACEALGLIAWDDPHNKDPVYGRARTRVLMGSLVDALGPSVVANLARTARLVAADTAALDRWAGDALDRALAASPDGSLVCRDLAELPEAVRSRVLHAWALRLGSAGTDVSHRHVSALEALVKDWHGQGAVYLPGAIVVRRVGGRLRRSA